MTSTMSRWIAAAEALRVNPQACVGCPKCGSGVLEYIDVPIPNGGDKVERHLFCSACWARNSVLFRDTSSEGL